MSVIYTEIPDNFCEAEVFVKTEIQDIKNAFFLSKKVFFYDACSFQRHAGLSSKEKNILAEYLKKCKAAVFITSCILMELTAVNHKLTENHIDYLEKLKGAGVDVVVFREEYLYNILSVCFHTNKRINEYLLRAVKKTKTPVSTIETTLKANKKLHSEIIKGENPKSSDLYQRLFSATREDKGRGDNLGEELISICVHVLSRLPGMPDGKICILTDDKGAAGKIYSATRKTNSETSVSEIVLFSTPKLIQHMFREGVAMSEKEMLNIISQGIHGNISVMGTTPFDLKVNEKISMSCEELVQRIREPNKINIVF